jgi:hypothetical protein
MENMIIQLPTATAEMLHLLARKGDQTIGSLLQQMALEHYVRHALGGTDGIVEVSVPEAEVS